MSYDVTDITLAWVCFRLELHFTKRTVSENILRSEHNAII